MPDMQASVRDDLISIGEGAIVHVSNRMVRNTHGFN